MAKVTVEEGLKMQGTEFIYEQRESTVKAYIKKFDPERGLSCWSFSLYTDQGYKISPINDEEIKEEACCVLMLSIKNVTMKEILNVLTEIRDTGRFKVGFLLGNFGGCTL